MNHRVETIRLGNSGVLLERLYQGNNEHVITITLEPRRTATLSPFAAYDPQIPGILQSALSISDTIGPLKFATLIKARPESSLKDILSDMTEDAPFLNWLDAILDKTVGRKTGLAQLVQIHVFDEKEGHNNE